MSFNFIVIYSVFALVALATPLSEAKLRLRPSLDQARFWSTHSALRLRFAVGARRIPVASRKPARADEEDLFMRVMSLFSYSLISLCVLELSECL